jgi:amidophosphoribosyltransferase
MLTKAGATEVHMRSGTPKITHDCDYGVNMGREEELLAHNRSLEEIIEVVGCHSLAFLSPEKMLEAIGMKFGETCTKCMTGVRPFQTKDQPTTIDELPEEFTAVNYRGGAG